MMGFGSAVSKIIAMFAVLGLCAGFLGCASISQTHSMDGVRFGMSRPEVRQALGAPDREDKISEQSENWVYAVDGDICSLEFSSGIMIRPPRCTSEAQRAWTRELAEIRDNPDKLERAQAQEQHEHVLLLAQREQEALRKAGKAPPPPKPVVALPPAPARQPDVACYFMTGLVGCAIIDAITAMNEPAPVTKRRR